MTAERAMLAIGGRARAWARLFEPEIAQVVRVSPGKHRVGIGRAVPK